MTKIEANLIWSGVFQNANIYNGLYLNFGRVGLLFCVCFIKSPASFLVLFNLFHVLVLLFHAV